LAVFFFYFFRIDLQQEFDGSQVLLSFLIDLDDVNLSKTRLLGGDIAPLLDHGLLDLPGVGPGPGADLLGDIHALLGGLQLGDKLGHVGTGPLGLEGAFFLGSILDNSLGLVIADFSALLESTASGGTQLPGLLGTSGDGGVLLHVLLLDAADLSGPLGALGEGGVSRGLILALLVLNGLALNNIILDIVFLLLGPALRLVLSSADLGSLNVTVLDQRGSADLDSLIESNLLVFDETVLPEVLLALLLLLGLVVGDVGGVAPSVVGVVTLDNLVVLGLLNHLNLVNTSLSISTRSSSSNCREADINVISSLTVTTWGQTLGSNRKTGTDRGFFVVGMIMMMISVLGIEGEGVEKGSLSSVFQSLQLAGCLAASQEQNNQNL